MLQDPCAVQAPEAVPLKHRTVDIPRKNETRNQLSVRAVGLKRVRELKMSMDDTNKGAFSRKRARLLDISKNKNDCRSKNISSLTVIDAITSFPNYLALIPRDFNLLPLQERQRLWEAGITVHNFSSYRNGVEYAEEYHLRMDTTRAKISDSAWSDLVDFGDLKETFGTGDQARAGNPDESGDVRMPDAGDASPAMEEANDDVMLISTDAAIGAENEPREDGNSKITESATQLSLSGQKSATPTSNEFQHLPHSINSSQQADLTHSLQAMISSGTSLLGPQLASPRQHSRSLLSQHARIQDTPINTFPSRSPISPSPMRPPVPAFNSSATPCSSFQARAANNGSPQIGPLQTLKRPNFIDMSPSRPSPRPPVPQFPQEEGQIKKTIITINANTSRYQSPATPSPVAPDTPTHRPSARPSLVPSPRPQSSQFQSPSPRQDQGISVKNLPPWQAHRRQSCSIVNDHHRLANGRDLYGNPLVRPPQPTKPLMSPTPVVRTPGHERKISDRGTIQGTVQARNPSASLTVHGAREMEQIQALRNQYRELQIAGEAQKRGLTVPQYIANLKAGFVSRPQSDFPGRQSQFQHQPSSASSASQSPKTPGQLTPIPGVGPMQGVLQTQIHSASPNMPRIPNPMSQLSESANTASYLPVLPGLGPLTRTPTTPRTPATPINTGDRRYRNREEYLAAIGSEKRGSVWQNGLNTPGPRGLQTENQYQHRQMQPLKSPQHAAITDENHRSSQIVQKLTQEQLKAISHRIAMANQRAAQAQAGQEGRQARRETTPQQTQAMQQQLDTDAQKLGLTPSQLRRMLTSHHRSELSQQGASLPSQSHTAEQIQIWQRQFSLGAQAAGLTLVQFREMLKQQNISPAQFIKNIDRSKLPHNILGRYPPQITVPGLPNYNPALPVVQPGSRQWVTQQNYPVGQGRAQSSMWPLPSQQTQLSGIPNRPPPPPILGFGWSPQKSPSQQMCSPSGILLPNLRRRIMISISGPTSSGKSTISHIVADILGPLTSIPEGEAVPILHQDTFFKVDEHCPKITYPTPSKREQTLYEADIKQRQYDELAILTSEANIGVKPRAVFGINEKSAYTYHQPSATSLRVATEVQSRCHAGGQPLMMMTEHNRDSRGSLNWIEFGRDFNILRGKIEGTARCQMAVGENPVHVGDAQASLRMLPTDTRSRLIADSFTAIKRAASENSKVGFGGKYVTSADGGRLRKIGIVDGFLLYLKPGRPPHGADGEKIMNNLDCKLFLPAREVDVRKRRFARKAYIYVKDGGEREDHMYWRTEAYFDGVAWPEYAKTHSWIFQNGDVEMSSMKDGRVPQTVDARLHGIFINESIDGSIAETAEWAVRTIIQRLLFEEGNERRAHIIRVNAMHNNGQQLNAMTGRQSSVTLQNRESGRAEASLMALRKPANLTPNSEATMVEQAAERQASMDKYRQKREKSHQERIANMERVAALQKKSSGNEIGLVSIPPPRLRNIPTDKTTGRATPVPQASEVHTPKLTQLVPKAMIHNPAFSRDLTPTQRSAPKPQFEKQDQEQKTIPREKNSSGG